ncbi:MAG: acyl-CoA thioesterase [Kiloniellales bacterium]|nr:acyl-CoA thioesterase [Kiloniellales bacterium]
MNDTVTDRPQRQQDKPGEAAETRAGFAHFLNIPTRWMDNDIYGHVNNVVYYSYFDTVINEYLIREGGLDIQDGSVVGVCAESACRYRAAMAFPEVIEAGLRVGHLGRRSVRYEIGLFQKGREEAAAEGHFVHVFVERPAMTPVPIPESIRGALESLRLG